MANPPIHIVVNRGRVTLTGVVQSNVERMLARSLATGFGSFEVNNALKTDEEMRVGAREDRHRTDVEPRRVVQLSVASSKWQSPVAVSPEVPLNWQLITGN